MTLEYRAIAGLPGYRVGSDGSVWSSQRTRHWKRLKCSPSATTGYPKVDLSRNGVVVTRNVHTLVLTAFCGARPEGAVCCHKRAIKAVVRRQNWKHIAAGKVE